MSEQDSPWKEALERYLPSFLALYFPAVHAAIDWTRGYEWLNTELRQVVRDAELGKRLADVLVKVWRKDGQESWDDVLQLFRIIDWMMDLPAVLEQLFKQEAEQIEQEIHMPYVTSVERIAIREERINLLIRALERRLKTAVPEELAARIRGTTDLVLLQQWFDFACEAASLEEFQQRMQS